MQMFPATTVYCKGIAFVNGPINISQNQNKAIIRISGN